MKKTSKKLNVRKISSPAPKISREDTSVCHGAHSCTPTNAHPCHENLFCDTTNYGGACGSLYGCGGWLCGAHQTKNTNTNKRGVNLNLPKIILEAMKKEAARLKALGQKKKSSPAKKASPKKGKKR